MNMYDHFHVFTDSKKIETSMVRGKFIKLVETRFIQRVPDPEIEAVQESTSDPDVTRQQAALYRLPSFVHDIGKYDACI